jgi:hypothetical protein
MYGICNMNELLYLQYSNNMSFQSTTKIKTAVSFLFLCAHNNFQFKPSEDLYPSDLVMVV